jgi:hypothetical protein
MTADLETYGFPPGYFIIRSVASKRLLDVTMDAIEDGTEVVLWPEKDSSIVESKPCVATIVQIAQFSLSKPVEARTPITRFVAAILIAQCRLLFILF